MKKLVITAPECSAILHYLKHSTLYYTKVEHNSYMYKGGMDTWDKAAAIIASFHPTEFGFIETEHYYRLRIWVE